MKIQTREEIFEWKGRIAQKKSKIIIENIGTGAEKARERKGGRSSKSGKKFSDRKESEISMAVWGTESGRKSKLRREKEPFYSIPIPIPIPFNSSPIFSFFSIPFCNLEFFFNFSNILKKTLKQTNKIFINF